MEWYNYRTFRVVDGQQIAGVFLPAIIHNHNHYFTLLAVYSDAMVDCWGLKTLDEFRKVIETGWVVNSVPEGATLDIHHFATFEIARSNTHGSIDDLLKEVASVIEFLNGRPPAQERMIKAISRFRQRDTEEHRLAMLAALPDVPTFHYHYLFSGNAEKCKEIRKILGVNLERDE